MGPAVAPKDESSLNIRSVGAEDFSIHCNHYLRLNVLECTDPYMIATKERMKTLKKFPQPNSLKDVIEMLGDQTDEHWIFRDRPGPITKTICVGIFNLTKQTWSLYKDNPKTNEALVVLPLILKN